MPLLLTVHLLVHVPTKLVLGVCARAYPFSDGEIAYCQSGRLIASGDGIAVDLIHRSGAQRDDHSGIADICGTQVESSPYRRRRVVLTVRAS